jgi:predicted TIM-barrel fold metal-dependent hydrolase
MGQSRYWAREERRMAIIDSDGHIFETRNFWRDHAPTKDRDKLLSIVDDENGYAWLAIGDQRTSVFAWWGEPGDWASGKIARQTLRQVAGTKADRNYDDMPRDHWDVEARLARIRAWGIDAAVEFPQWTFLAKSVFESDVEALHANFAAWNRFAIDVQRIGGGTYLPAGIVSFEEDFSFAEEQLRGLAAGGVKMALMTPDLINEKRLSHPDNDRVWQLFVNYGIVPVWHISTASTVVSKEWVDNEPGWYKVLEASFSRIQPQLCLTDLAVNGTFHKFPDLMIALVEYRPDWLPQLLFRMDNSYMMRRTHHGGELTPEMDMKPSDYVRRQARFSVFAEEGPVQLSDRLGSNELLMWGSDYPHPEGIDNPLDTFESQARAKGTALENGLYGENAAALLRLA